MDKYGVQLPGTDYSGGDIQCKDLENSNNSEWKWGGPPATTPPPPPIHSYHVTQGPCPLSDPHLPVVHSQNLRKKMEKKKNILTRSTKETPANFHFYFLLLTKYSPPNCGGDVLDDSLDRAVWWAAFIEAGPQIRQHVHALDGYIYFFRRWGFHLRFVIWKLKKFKEIQKP